ncbi:MAG: DUF6048 family protein [Bacteroidales bacterium]|jgi:hypothetical protein
MGKISGYSFSLLLFLWTGMAFSQTDTGRTRTVDARIGFDVSKLALFYLQPERKTFEGSLDMELFPNAYPIVELGVNTIRLHEDTLFNYYSSGYYGRLGVDYNLISPKSTNDKDMFMGGIRFGYAFYTDHADSIKIKDNYWGDFHGSLPPTAMNAEWIELLAGLRAEVFKNFYLGCSLRWRILLSKTKEDPTEPYWIPGYGKGTVKSCFGFNYSIYYAIPVYKRQFKVKEVKKDK